MYLGFDYETALEGGLGAKTTVPGSLTIFLLALTRGCTKLVKNSGEAKNFMGKDEEGEREEFERSDSPYMYKIHKVCERIIKSSGLFRRRTEKDSDEEENYPRGDLSKKQNEIIDKNVKKRKPQIVKINKLGRHPKFKSASPDFITVRSKIPNLFLLIILLGVALILVYAIFYWRRILKMQDEDDMWLDYISGLIALISITIGVTFLTFKCIFKNWDLSDMIHSHRNTSSLSEMIQVLEGKKTEAVAVCSRIENSEIVFSKWRSNSFVYNGGAGNFQIDTSIKIRHLQLAGYIFGVDFQGNSIVSDCHGNIRQLHFFRNKDELTSTDSKLGRNEVYIGKPHPLQMKLFFKIPIANMFTSSSELFYT